MENERIERARKEREALLMGRNAYSPATEGRELTQSERDAMENERIERARREREALLSGRAASNDVYYFLAYLEQGSQFLVLSF